MLPAYLAHFQRVELVCNSQWGRALQMPDKQTALIKVKNRAKHEE